MNAKCEICGEIKFGCRICSSCKKIVCGNCQFIHGCKPIKKRPSNPIIQRINIPINNQSNTKNHKEIQKSLQNSGVRTGYSGKTWRALK